MTALIRRRDHAQKGEVAVDEAGAGDVFDVHSR